jgi:hypothetical protein
MTDQEFEAALIDAAFALGAEAGWLLVSPPAAARHGGLDLARARFLFPCTGTILKKFGRLADASALANASGAGSVRDRLFDLIMLRFDYLQGRRPGVRALMRVLPFCPPLALALTEMNLASMGWLLEAAGVETGGIKGALRKRGLLAVWLYGLRAWDKDESADLSATMAAVDKALVRAERFALRFTPGPSAATSSDAAMQEPPAVV